MSLRNQKCEIQCILINLHPNEYGQELHYYPFAVKLDKFVGSLNTINDLLNKVCALNKTEDINTCFQYNYRKNKSNVLTKDISCKCNCKFDKRNFSSNQKWIIINVDVSVKNMWKRLCLECFYMQLWK